MLTADLVRVRKLHGELKLAAFDAKHRARAEQIAAAYLEIYDSHLGRSRDELEESLQAIEIDPRDRLLARGLKKLLDDRAEFDAESSIDPELARRTVFERAAAARRALGLDETFDRSGVLRQAAEELGAPSAEALEASLFADLRGAQLLRSTEQISPAALVSAYDAGRAQAVLLRAVRVRVEVECAAPAAYRALFQKLKFLRLLHTIEPRGVREAGARSALWGSTHEPDQAAEGGALEIEDEEDAGYSIHIDGPMSLFESVTKYGLELASLLPVLEECEYYALHADVRWSGFEGTLSFRTEGGYGDRDEEAKAAPEQNLSDEVSTLLERLRALGSDWKIGVAREILELPGVGLCIPDLVFERASPQARVHLEVMGHWSRAAVWKRVELVEAGLARPIVFAVSTRLRVSEEALPEDAPAALYVYKGTMSARAVLEKVEAVAAR